jgi:hypothetical protein
MFEKLCILLLVKNVKYNFENNAIKTIFLVGKHLRKRPLELKRRWEDNIKMDLTGDML